MAIKYDEFGMEREELKTAGFGIRLGAYLIDTMAISAAFYLLVFIFGIIGFASIGGMSGLESIDSGDGPSDALVVGLVAGYFGMIFLFIIFYYLYFSLFESSKYQASLGKLAVGIIVTDMEGERISFLKALGRNLGKFISGIIIYIGFLMPLWTEKQQTLHDIMASCLVVEKPRDY